MSDLYTLGAFLAAIVVLVLLIARFKVHPVATLFIVVVTLSLVLGIGGEGTIELVTTGFGSTLANVGLLIIFGCVLGKMLELSGAALKITETALRMFAEKRVPWAIALASVVLGIPLIADTAVVMLIPIVSALAYRTGISMMKLGPILYIGAYVMTSVVPPGPGPLASAALLDVSMGEAILYGLVVGLPGVFAATLYLSRLKTYVAPKPEFVEHLVSGSETVPGGTGTGAAGPGAAGTGTGSAGTGSAADGAPGVGLFGSLVPILAPILLIVIAALAAPVLPEGSPVTSVILFAGEPTIALFLACLLALPLFRGRWRDKATLNDLFESGLRIAAMPMALTGVGGALATVIRDTGVAENIAAGIENAGLSPIIIPFLVAAAVCTITGSNILGVMTSAAIMQPLLPELDLAPLAVYLACATGAQIMKHANSSGFWVTTTLSNMTVGQGIRSIGVASAISGVTGFAVLYAMTTLGVI
ncbi:MULTISPECIES: GntP family permease [Nocardiopsis]|uniref:GntP family permease n=1 Tax=Nocardiopsis changdeensis TaxID=2831969 RepID=A0ABX8BRN2_9ACTN|nr:MULTISPECIES: SLC13 family permease [Nocardiopsis]QUX24917.1 GntP family permease [Nocardiopsis changdeensis]QYX35303.1 GntP family permease [Nocardiopsis sp. MT53]